MVANDWAAVCGAGLGSQRCAAPNLEVVGMSFCFFLEVTRLLFLFLPFLGSFFFVGWKALTGNPHETPPISGIPYFETKPVPNFETVLPVSHQLTYHNLIQQTPLGFFMAGVTV